MKNVFTKFKWFIIGAAVAWFVLPMIVWAVNVTIPQSTQKGDLPTGNANGTYGLLHPGTNGKVLTASSSATNGLDWTTVGGTGTVTSVDMTVPTGLAISGNPITTTGTLGLSLQAGYNIPLTASTTNWNGFYNTPSTRITAGTYLSWSGNTLNGSSSPTFTNLTVTATTTLGATTTINGLNYFWPSSVSGTKILQNDGSGNLSWVADQTGGGGSVSGGTRGFVATWASSTGLTTGVLIDNGTVAGVNATSSSANFTVKGTAALSPLLITSSTGTTMFQLFPDNSVNLNSTSTTLYDDGAVVATSTSVNIRIANTNTLMGMGVGPILDYQTTSATGFLNRSRYGFTMFGYNAGHNLVASSTMNTICGDAYGLVGIGAHALEMNTTGAENTAVGDHALANLTTGCHNTSVGMDAGQALTTGGSNTIMGLDALPNNTTSSNNTIIGTASLYNHLTGDANTILGAGVGSTMTSGANNILIGYGAYSGAKTGTKNIIIGESASNFGTTSNETVIGYKAAWGGVNVGTRQNNTILGFQSGYNLTSGSNNIFLGYQAATTTTSGSNNIVLGYDIATPAITSSNTLNIGNILFGTNIDGAGTTLSSGNIGIATSSPDARLVIVGAGGTKSPFIISSSSGNTLFQVGYNGSTTISSLGTGCVGAISGSLYIATSTCAGGGGGGGGTASGTTGAIQFSDGSGGFDANDGFTWVNSTGRLLMGGVGSSPMLLISNTTTPVAGTSIGQFEMNKDASNILVVGSHVAGGPTPGIVGYSSRGTTNAPGSTLATDFLLSISGRGFGSSTYSSLGKATINFQAESNWTDADQSTNLNFQTTAASSTTRTEKMRITGSGRIGIGTTTPAAQLVVVGTAGTNPPLNISSSTGTALLQVDANGSTTIASLSVAACDVKATATGGLFCGTDATGGGGGSGTISTSTNLTTNSIPIVTGASTLGNSSLSQSAGTTLINGVTPIMDGGGNWLSNVIQTSGASVIIQAPTSTAFLGNVVQSGGVTAYSTSTNLSATAIACGVGLGYITSTSALGTTLKFPDLSTINTAVCNGQTFNPAASSFSQQFVYVGSTSSPTTIAPSGTGESFMYAPGSGATVQPGQVMGTIGQFIASSTIYGATTSGMTLTAYLQGFQPRATNPTMQGQFLMASSTASGGNPEWVVGNIAAGTQITVSTSTPGQILITNGYGSAIDPTELASADFGSFTCNGTTCTLDNGSVDLTTKVTGVLPASNGGIGTTTLGDLTVSSSNLSISGGQKVLIGTSTQITLTANPTFTNLTYTNASGSSESLSGNLWVTGTTTLATITTPTLAGALALGGSTGILGKYGGSSCSGQFARSLSAAGSILCQKVDLTADISGILPVANGGTGAANLTTADILFGNGTSAVGTSTNFTFTTGSNTLAITGTTTISNLLGLGTTTPLIARFTLQNAAGTTDAIRIASSTGATMTLFDYSGHLQIGTTTSTSGLAIQGVSGSTIPNFTISTSTGATLFTVLANGNVGIGSTSPSSLFTVDSGTAAGTASTTVIIPQKFQIDTYNSAGTRVCMTIVGTTPTVTTGACP